MKTSNSIKIATYNIHKCQGLDRRIKPERIVEVIQEVDADVIALQEVVSAQGADKKADQAQYIADELGYNFRLGETRRHFGGAYGNVILSRFPIIEARNHDISVNGREERGCLRADIDLGTGSPLHIYNVHLGTSYLERRHQARRLLHDDVLANRDHSGPRVLLGDFNEWVQGLASRLLRQHFKSADIRERIGRARTYPGVLPFLHLDHIYFDNSLRLEHATLHRSRTALIASDHLPVVAELKLETTPPLPTSPGS